MYRVATSLLVACLLAWVTEASVDVGLERYEDMLMQNLYKRLSQIDSTYLGNNDLDDLQEAGSDYQALQDDDAALMQDVQPHNHEHMGTEQSSAEIRDSESIQHGSHFGTDGFIHMSGGAGEGQQHLTPNGEVNNLKEEGKSAVKSDESLPFYCHPSNPCPKGYTAEQGCQLGIEDTAEAQRTWITKMQEEGFCSCDREHMFNCPDKVSSKTSGGNGEQSILTDKQAAATYMSGEKRLTLVAKKSPRVKRSLTDEKMEQELKRVSDWSQKRSNPYLGGERLGSVVKKG